MVFACWVGKRWLVVCVGVLGGYYRDQRMAAHRECIMILHFGYLNDFVDVRLRCYSSLLSTHATRLTDLEA